MNYCANCGYYNRIPDRDFGNCHANPPVIMLMPVMADKASQIASGGNAQGIAPQTVRPMVMSADRACRHCLIEVIPHIK